MRIRKTGTAALWLWAVLLCTGATAGEPVWIDVRTALEHSEDSIDGDVRISHGDIVNEVRQRFPDTDTEIQLYCRSGNRAGIAMSALQEAGYLRVSNAGSIDDARTQRGLRN
ncbi:MAG: rhodanese-like domain-containing protein [Congregibacter sp.]